MSWVEDRDVWFECQVSDDLFDTLEGNRIGGSIVTGEVGDCKHEVMSCIVAEGGCQLMICRILCRSIRGISVLQELLGDLMRGVSQS